MENPELISTALGIIPGAIDTLGIFLEKRRMVLVTVGAATLITVANIVLTVLTDDTSNLIGTGISMPIIAGGVKGLSGNKNSNNG